MNRLLIFSILILLAIQSHSQVKPLLVFDLKNGTMDSLPSVVFDTTVLSDKSNYSLGNYNSTIETLEQIPPLTNTYPNSNFTYKKQASLDFDLTSFPLRTSLKMYTVLNDTLADLCSANMISSKHVITAAHCVSNITQNTLLFDSLQVFPVFDNGIASTHFSSSAVSKVYFFKDWTIGGGDIAILELEDPIGLSTGWLSIGFDQNDNNFANDIFYKFSYPAATIVQIDSNEYNGDTLFYNYGNVDLFTSTTLAINNVSAISGESGSSLIKIVNGQEYTSYGVLSLSYNLTHSRISNWQFYALKNMIKDDLTSISSPIASSEHWQVYPNPVEDIFFIENKEGIEIDELVLLDNLGKAFLYVDAKLMSSGIDISNLSSGLYYLIIRSKNHSEMIKLIKR